MTSSSRSEGCRAFGTGREMSCGVSKETAFSGKEGRVSAGRIFRSYNVEIPDPEDCVKVLNLDRPPRSSLISLAMVS